MQRIDAGAAALRRWKNRFDASHRNIMNVLETVVGDEFDWAPDDGIATVRDHVWSVCESTCWLARRLSEGGIAPAQANAVRAKEVPFEAMKLRFERAHRVILNWLAAADGEDLFDFRTADVGAAGAMPYCYEDLFQHHLELASYHRAAIMLLLQLIDPARSPKELALV